MFIYFVRHGETDANKQKVHQRENTPLSSSGLHQAEQLAERFTHLNVDVIVSSPMKRAQQTAEKIAEVTRKEIVLNPLLGETKKPSSFIDKRYDDPEILSVKEKIIQSFHIPSFRHEDEETFSDMKERAENVSELLETYDLNNVVCVTHGDFLRMILARMSLGEELTAQNYLRFHQWATITNTGLTICEFTNDRGWKLITLNDFAHLGDK